MPTPSNFPVAGWLLVGLALVLPARAEAQTDNRLREALRSATVKLQALEDERTAWLGRKAAMEKELEAARAQAAAAARGQGRASEREVAELKRRLAETSATSAQGEASLAGCQATAAEAARGAAAREQELAGLKTQVAQLTARNARLYEVGQGIIDWLSKMGFGTAVLVREPFLGRKRVELENAAQVYQDQLQDQRAVTP